MASLVVKSGPLAGQTIDVTAEVTVGREGADITLDDAEVSRLHATLRPRGDELEVEDLGSMNGTFVDDERIATSTVLRDGSKLKIGHSIFDVEIPPPPAPMTQISQIPVDAAMTRAHDVPPPAQEPDVADVSDEPEPPPGATRVRPLPSEPVPASPAAQDPVLPGVPDATRLRPLPAGQPAPPVMPPAPPEAPAATPQAPPAVVATRPPDVTPPAPVDGSAGLPAELKVRIAALIVALVIATALITYLLAS